MPRIPIYEQQTRVSGAGLGPSAESASAGARGLVALGGALEQVSRNQDRLQAFERQKAEERAAVWAQERLMGVRSKWLEELQRRQREAPENPEGFTPSVLADFDRERDELIEQAPTEGARNWLSERLGAVRLGLQEDALRFEASRAVDYKVSGLMRATDAARTAAEFRPGDFAELAAEQRAAIEASGLPADMQAKLTQESVTSIASAAVQGMIRRDPYATLRALNDENTRELAVRALTFDQRQALRNRAEAEIRQREAEARARQTELRQALSAQLADIAAAAQSGIPVTSTPSRAELQLVFGEREGAQRYESAQRLARLSGEMAALHQMTPEQIAAQVERYRPREVSGAAEGAQLHGWVARAAGQILDAREKDPAGYLIQHSPTVQSAWQALQQADEAEQPEAAAAYLRAVNAERERLGIRSTDLLPKAYAESIVANLTRPQAGEQLAANMAAEAQRWGPAWPGVYRQIANDLPDTALVIGAGIPPRAANALATMSTLRDEQVKAQVLTQGVTWKELVDKVDGELEDMARTFGPEGAPVLTAIRSSAQKLTAAYMAQGSSLSDAATQAARDLANDRYTFLEFRDHTYRVPIDIDADLVDEGATLALERFQLVSGTVPEVPGQPEEVLLSQATTAIRRSGYWVTAPDESGLRLYYNGQPVPGADGLPVQFSWDALLSLAGEREAQLQEARERAERQRREGAPGVL